MKMKRLYASIHMGSVHLIVVVTSDDRDIVLVMEME